MTRLKRPTSGSSRTRSLSGTRGFQVEQIGHSVDWQVDGLAASEILDFTPYDLVILDVMLPGLDGFEILRRLRRIRRLNALE